MIIQILDFQIKFCRKSPALRVAAKRYASFTKTIKKFIMEIINIENGNFSLTEKMVINANKSFYEINPNYALAK